MTIRATYTLTGASVEVIQDGEERAYVKFPDGKVLWVVADALDFDNPDGDDFDDVPGLDSPTDFDEYEMNADDCADPGDQYDFEYDR